MSLEQRIARIDDWAAGRVKTPVAAGLERLRITATKANFIGLAGCVVAAALVPAERFLVAGCIFFASSALDYFDGTLARRQGTAKTFSLGAWLDAFLGSVGEAAVYVGAAFVIDDPDLMRLLLMTMLTTLLTSHAKAVAGEYGIVADWREAGGLGRGVRILMASAGLVAVGLAGDHAGTAAACTLFVLLAFNLLTLAYRIRKVVVAAFRSDRKRRSQKAA